MYFIREEKKEEIKKIRTNYYSKKLGITPNFVSNILNGRIKCTEITARGIISIYYDISLNDTRIEELLEEYFKEE